MHIKTVNNLNDVFDVVSILHACGKDMAAKYNIHHWDNSRLKTLIIVLLLVHKNEIVLIKDNGESVATFQTRVEGDALFFEKLAVQPEQNSKGIGSFCLREIENKARDKGLNKIRMDVYSKSDHALQFYYRRGYSKIGENKTLKYEVVRMEKVNNR